MNAAAVRLLSAARSVGKHRMFSTGLLTRRLSSFDIAGAGPFYRRVSATKNLGAAAVDILSADRSRMYSTGKPTGRLSSFDIAGAGPFYRRTFPRVSATKNLGAAAVDILSAARSRMFSPGPFTRRLSSFDIAGAGPLYRRTLPRVSATKNLGVSATKNLGGGAVDTLSAARSRMYSTGLLTGRLSSFVLAGTGPFYRRISATKNLGADAVDILSADRSRMYSTGQPRGRLSGFRLAGTGQFYGRTQPRTSAATKNLAAAASGTLYGTQNLVVCRLNNRNNLGGAGFRLGAGTVSTISLGAAGNFARFGGTLLSNINNIGRATGSTFTRIKIRGEVSTINEKVGRHFRVRRSSNKKPIKGWVLPKDFRLKKYQCPICYESFISNRKVQKHCKIVHKIQSVPNPVDSLIYKAKASEFAFRVFLKFAEYVPSEIFGPLM